MRVYGVSLSIQLNRSEKRPAVCAKIGKCFADGDDSIFHEMKEGRRYMNNHRLHKLRSNLSLRNLIGLNELKFFYTLFSYLQY